MKHETWRWQRRAWLAAWKIVNDRDWTVVKADRKWNNDTGSSPTCTDRLSRQQTNHSLRKQPLAGCHWADNTHTHTHIHSHTIRELWLNQHWNHFPDLCYWPTGLCSFLRALRSDTFYMFYIYGRNTDAIQAYAANRTRDLNSQRKSTSQCWVHYSLSRNRKQQCDEKNAKGCVSVGVLLQVLLRWLSTVPSPKPTLIINLWVLSAALEQNQAVRRF